MSETHDADCGSRTRGLCDCGEWDYPMLLMEADKLKAEIDRLSLRVAELTAGLRPFAAGADAVETSSSEEARKSGFCHWPASYEECARARTLLTASQEGK